MDPLAHLPDAVMLLLLTYITSIDYRYLSHGSHGYRHFITENDLLHFRFQGQNSWLYYQGCIGRNIRVAGSGMGNRLNLYEEVERRGGKVMKLDLSSRQEVRDVSMLGGVRELILTNCKGVTSGFECLGGVHSLNLRECTQIRDEHITNLGTVSVLNLNYCENITNVRHLGGVRELNLTNCTAITSGFECLGGVYSLNLSWCSQLRDEHITNLGTVSVLNLRACESITNVSHLGGVRELILSICSGITSGFECLGGVHSIDLSDCDQLRDEHITNLGTVSVLNLSGCASITNVSHLGGVKELNLSECRGITSGFECLGGVHSLSLSYCTQLRDEHITNLGTVSVLNLRACESITNVSHLGGVRELDLSACTGVTSGFECLGGVHSLNLGLCTQLRDEHITNLGTVSVLDLSGCQSITNVSHLGGVKELNLSECGGITAGITSGFEYLGGVHSLRLSGCTQIRDEHITNLGTVSVLKNLM
jgi:hypothetical protein